MIKNRKVYGLIICTFLLGALPVNVFANPQDNVLGMNHVRNAEKNFKQAQEAEQKGLNKRASFFYEEAVQSAQWSLAYIIKDYRDDMKRTVRDGEQKLRDLKGKQDMEPVVAEGIQWPKVKNAREIESWVKANIKYNSDEKLHGEQDYWQTPEETMVLRQGDCEDYAFLNQELLRRINIESIILCISGGFSVKGTHAICAFPKDSPTSFFDNQYLRKSNSHVLYLVKSEYPRSQKLSILEFKDRKTTLILETKWPFVYKVIGNSRESLELYKTFLGKWDAAGTLFVD